MRGAYRILDGDSEPEDVGEHAVRPIAAIEARFLGNVLSGDAVRAEGTLEGDAATPRLVKARESFDGGPALPREYVDAVRRWLAEAR